VGKGQSHREFNSNVGDRAKNEPEKEFKRLTHDHSGKASDKLWESDSTIQ